MEKTDVRFDALFGILEILFETAVSLLLIPEGASVVWYQSEKGTG